MFIQARASSARLPGKVLKTVGGKPLLQYLVERLRHGLNDCSLVLATSDGADDDAVASLGERLGVRVERGSLDDVVDRFLGAARRCGVASFVRLSGDSPLLDPALVDRAAGLFDEERADLVTNVFPRSFPKGQSVEVIAVEALERAAAASGDAEDREHVTRYLYQHADRFRIRNFAHEPNCGDMQLSVDTAADFDLFCAMVARMTRPHWDYGVDELIELRRSLMAGA